MKRYISSTILALVIAGLPTVALAKGPNPVTGYLQVLNNIETKGANYGRCNALDILGNSLFYQGVFDNNPAIPKVSKDVAAACG